MSYKKRAISLVSAALLLLPVSFANAQESTTWFGNSADGQWLVGVKLGQLENNSQSGFFDELENYTLVLGYQFARRVGTNGSASIELDLSESDDADFDSHIAGSQWNARTVGLFIAYRTPGKVYFKGKVGLMYSKLEFDEALPKEDDTNVAFGAGFGLLLGARQNMNLELEYTGTSGDNDLDIWNLVGLYRF